jgi:hypothetical protein
MNDSPPDPLDEPLVDHRRRTCSVETHQAFRKALAPPPAFDEIDELAAEAVLDRLPARRGGKLVGKRVAIRIPTTDAEIAVMVRDAVLDFCLAVGLRITRRAQKRKQNGGRQ